MKQLELKTLIGQLSTELRQALETAAALCVSRKHKVVEIEHWLMQLCREPGAAMRQIITSQKLSVTTMIDDLEQRLNRLPGGFDGTPALAHNTVILIQDAWLIASVNFHQQTIAVHHLILALLDNDSFALVETPLTTELHKISRDALQAQVAASSEIIAADEPKASALNKYTTDMTAAAASGEASASGGKVTGGKIVGRDQEIRQIIDILCRRRQNSPILVGDAGVGKTAVVEGLAQKVISEDVPDNLKGIQILNLDLGLLQAGASIKGEFENRLKDLINEVKQSERPVIVFIDEAHTLIGAGGAAGQNDAANLLKPALARGEFRTIAATTWAEYKKFFEKDAALTRRFQPVKIHEPDEETAIHMVRSVALTLEQHHKTRVHDDAVTSAVRLSIRYLPERQLPDKAISLLDTACSRVSLSRHTTPMRLQEMLQQERYLRSELSEVSRDEATGLVEPEQVNAIREQLKQVSQDVESVKVQWQKEQALVEELVTQEKTIDEQYQQAGTVNKALRKKQETMQEQLQKLQGQAPMVYPRVDADSVAAVVSGWTGIPVGNMLSDEIQRLLTLEESLRKRVIGQDQAIAEISKSVRIGRAGLSDPRKPIGVFLMCGPSGVGKTETGLALADELYGGEQNLTVLNMTEFKEEHKVSMLLGAPAGYVGYGEGGVLTEAVRRSPYSVLLLDEMEKAHPGVHDIFYQIFDKGRIADSEGREVDFRQTIIIMTSNAADAAICDLVDQFEQEGKGIPDSADIAAVINDELLHFFKPAFLGRLTLIPYLPLNNTDMAKICRLTLQRMEKNLAARYGALLVVDDAAIEQLVAWNDSPQTGARAIEQQVNRRLMPVLAEECLSRLAKGESITEVRIGLENHQLEFSVQ
ncbi:type VI secretion system ATPase TssH [Endozoicomonas euniceicola]|uniref:Type VI secretion system ATPase TssH n=1 Tax=Endozoicomonas euniceicola TaxID=1234143 RepID=A0ABY6GQ23_9GAMM|nr:type VI secretion system ATPase TssH [Endozoicomonas euniceicola]UYM14855.1 type VI secretion system ATPase TssH [Endozoicomonas euniceicola]